MKILELFSGTECLSNAFRARGHECFTVDWDRRFPSSLHIDIIRSLHPRFFFIENPMGGLRKMDYMQGIPRHLITYCQYGFKYRKATDIFTNHPCPEFKPPCKNGDPCHQSAPRGTKQGLQSIQDKADRSKYPPNYASISLTSVSDTLTKSRCPSVGTSRQSRPCSWNCFQSE